MPFSFNHILAGWPPTARQCQEELVPQAPAFMKQMSLISLCSYCGQCQVEKKPKLTHNWLTSVSFKEKIKNTLCLDYRRKARSQLDGSSQEKTMSPLPDTLSCNAHQRPTQGFRQATDHALSSFFNCSGYEQLEYLK